MSHALEIVNGEASMVYKGEVPWHGLGVRVGDDAGIKEMIVAAQLDWTVEKKPLVVQGTKVEIPGKRALVRSSDNKVLDIVSDKWIPVQNIEAFEFFSEFVDAGDMEIHTAGSLKEGQVVWCLAKVDADFELFGGDKVESFLLFSNYHKFGVATDIRFTPIRVVCNNTMQLALSSEFSGRVGVSHRQVFSSSHAKLMLGIVQEKMHTYKEMVEFLGTRKCSHEKIKEYFAAVFPLLENVRGSEYSRNANIAMQIVENQPGGEYAKGSFWQAYNASTFLLDHHVGHNQSTRLHSAWYGPNKLVKEKALNTAITMAKKAHKLKLAA